MRSVLESKAGGTVVDVSEALMALPAEAPEVNKLEQVNEKEVDPIVKAAVGSD